MDRLPFVIGDLSLDKLNDMVVRLMTALDVRDPKQLLLLIRKGRVQIALQREPGGRPVGVMTLPQPLVSDGSSGHEWLQWLSGMNVWNLDVVTAEYLGRADFVWTSGREYRVVLVRSDSFSRNPTPHDVRQRARELGLVPAPPETAFLLVRQTPMRVMKEWKLSRIGAVIDHEGFMNVTTPSYDERKELLVFHREETRLRRVYLESWDVGGVRQARIGFVFLDPLPRS